jgi:hypothetical protein
MSKSAESTEGRKAASSGQLWLRLPGLVREALYETVIGAGLVVLPPCGYRKSWLESAEGRHETGAV